MDRNVLNSLISQSSPRLKSSMPFLKMARDNFDSNPIVSYWALMFVLETGIKSTDQNEELRMLLVTIMPWLEQEKVLRKDDPLFASEIAAKDFITGYADQIVGRAEDELNNPETDASTCTKLFLTASNVYKLLSLFGIMSDDVQQRMKYAKWRAVSLYRDGKPQPGDKDPADPRNTDDQQAPPSPGINRRSSSTEPLNQGGSGPASSTPPVNPPAAGFFDYPSPETPKEGSSFMPPPPPPPGDAHIAPKIAPPPAPAPRGPSAAAASSQDLTGAKVSALVSSSDLRRAELLCESALCAIKDKDVQAAITGLKDTLNALKISVTVKKLN